METVPRTLGSSVVVRWILLCVKEEMRALLWPTNHARLKQKSAEPTQ